MFVAVFCRIFWGVCLFRTQSFTCSRMIWILTTSLILLRCKHSPHRFQYWIGPLAVSSQRVSPVLSSINSSDFHSWEDQFYQRSILNRLIVCVYNGSLPSIVLLSFQTRKNWLTCLVFSRLADAKESSTFRSLTLHRETKFIIGFDFAVTFFTWIFITCFSTSLQNTL